MKFVAAAVTFLVLGFIGGSYYGYYHGQRDYLMMEQIAQGALAVHYLNHLENGKLEILENGFELYIDAALDRFYRYKHGEFSPLANQFLELDPERLEEYVDRMAAYRSKNPIVFSPFWAEPKESDDEATAEWRAEEHEGSVQMVRNIKSVLESRGVSAP